MNLQPRSSSEMDCPHDMTISVPWLAKLVMVERGLGIYYSSVNTHLQLIFEGLSEKTGAVRLSLVAVQTKLLAPP
jgi:hypothetical protein